MRIWNAENGHFEGKLGEPDQQPRDWVWSVAFSPDGKKVASASKDGTVRIWPYPKPASGPWPAPEIFAHVGLQDDKPVTVHSVAFDPSGTRLITSCHDGTARVWDVASKKEIVRLAGHIRADPNASSFVRAASFCPTAPSLVVTAGQDNTAKLWSLDDVAIPAEGAGIPVRTEPLLTLHAKSDEDQGMWDAQFSPDGTLLITAGGDHMVTIWDVKTGLVLADSEAHANAVIAAKFIDGQSAVSVGIDKTVRLWSIERVAEFVQPDGLAVPAKEAAANAWRRTLTPKGILRGHTDYLRNVDIAPDHRRLVTSSRDGTARVWQLPPSFEVAALRTEHIVWDVAFSPEGGRVVTASGHTPMIWQIENFKTEPQSRELPRHEEIVKYVAWSGDGKLIATASQSRAAHGSVVRICDADAGTELHGFELPPGVSINALAFDPASRHLALAAGKEAIVWDRDTFALATAFTAGATIFAVGFSPDGAQLVTGGEDQYARVWDWKSGRELAHSHKHDDMILDAAFSPDGTLLVTAGSDGNVVVLDAKLEHQASGELAIDPAILRGHEGQVRKARFFTIKDDHGSRLGILSAGFDSTVRIWEVSAITNHWTQTAQIPGATGPIYAVACNADGTQIVTGGADKVGRVYYRDPNWLFELAKTRVTRELTAEEKAKYGIAPNKR